MSEAESRVLVVSDEDHIREEAEFGFPEDYQIVFAEDATDAWQLLDELVPSLVIVSLRTGNAGGFALARDMSQRNDLADVPVMILLERVQDEWLARQARAALFRTKPLAPGELVADALDLLGKEKVTS